MNKSERLRLAREAARPTGPLIGCYVGNALLLASALAILTTRWWWLAIVPGLITLVWFGSVVRDARLMSRFRSKGHRALIVTSDSAVWKERIESTWVPALGPRVVILNRSRDEASRDDFSWTVAKSFIGLQEEFCPAVLVVPPSGRGRVFCFYRAFHEAKHGNVRPLEHLENTMFEFVARTAA